VSVLTDPPEPQPSSFRGPWIVTGAVALVLVVAGWLFITNLEVRPGPAERPAADPAAEAEPMADATAEPDAEPLPIPEARLGDRPPPAFASPSPAPAPRAAAGTATLIVESDVPGASVFLDREYLGETPLRAANLPPGTRRLNLSATGYDGISREVTLEPGDQTVAMRFKEVRLNLSQPVVHRHRIGSCEGRLIATLDGLRYDTTDTDDAFSLAYEDLETFEVNYLEKNLRVKARGGRTWNFTERNAENADALFVFHRDVMAARDKLAKGYAPVR
jgi:hypothetical protein